MEKTNMRLYKTLQDLRRNSVVGGSYWSSHLEVGYLIISNSIHA